MTARPIPDAPPVTNAVRATNDEEVEGEVGEDMTAAGNGRVRPEGEGRGGDETYHYGWVTGKWGSRTLILQDARTKPPNASPKRNPPPGRQTRTPIYLTFPGSFLGPRLDKV